MEVTSGVHAAEQFEALALRARREDFQRVAHDLLQIEIDGLENELAGFDLREIEDVVDERQQRVGAIANGLA